MIQSLHYVKMNKSNNNIYLIYIEKKQKRLRIDELHSDQSELDENIPRKRISYYVSSNSDLESYDVSNSPGKEPTNGFI